jgi:hypothetical protein
MAILYSNADVNKPSEVIISTETLGAPGTFALVTIPQTYREVVLRVTGQTFGVGEWDYVQYELNGDSSSVYQKFTAGDASKATVAAGAGSSTSYARLNQTSVWVGYVRGTGGTGTVYTGQTETTLFDYTTSKTTHILWSKGGRRETSASLQLLMQGVQQHWYYPASTTAITSVEIVTVANFDTGSTFTVLGRGPL